MGWPVFSAIVLDLDKAVRGPRTSLSSNRHCSPRIARSRLRYSRRRQIGPSIGVWVDPLVPADACSSLVWSRVHNGAGGGDSYGIVCIAIRYHWSIIAPSQAIQPCELTDACLELPLSSKRYRSLPHLSHCTKLSKQAMDMRSQTDTSDPLQY